MIYQLLKSFKWQWVQNGVTKLNEGLEAVLPGSPNVVWQVWLKQDVIEDEVAEARWKDVGRRDAVEQAMGSCEGAGHWALSLLSLPT